MDIKKIWLFVLLLCCFNTTNAVAQEEVSSLIVEAQATYYASRNTAVQQSLFGKELFVIHTLKNGVGLMGFTYHDAEYWNALLGVTYEMETDRIGYLQFGLGAGKAVYKDYDSFFTLNPILYWNKGPWLVNIYTEYTPKETGSSKLFWKYSIQRSFGKNNNWFAGVYGERFMGDGPMLGYSFGKGFSLWISKPFHSDNKLLLALSWSKE